MLASGSRPHAAVYSSIIDVLWQTGIPWAQAKALHLFNSAVQCVASSYHKAAWFLWQNEQCMVTNLPGKHVQHSSSGALLVTCCMHCGGHGDLLHTFLAGSVPTADVCAHAKKYDLQG